MERRPIMKRLLLFPLLILLLTGGAARAATSIDVAVGVQVDEDTRIFLNVTNQTWRPPLATTFIRRCAYPQDEFPVVAFLTYYSHRSPDYILGLRRAGYDWSDIFFQLHVNPKVLFVGIDRNPGPPYGRAWGRWTRDRGYGARRRYRLSDRDVVALVKVQTAARHFGASPYDVIEAPDGGRRVEVYTANRWRERHGRDSWDRDRGRDRRQRRGWGGDEDTGDRRHPPRDESDHEGDGRD